MAGWVGAICTFWYECLLVVLACESLHICTVCIWRCEHARFCADFFNFYVLYIHFHSFIHTYSSLILSVHRATLQAPVGIRGLSLGALASKNNQHARGLMLQNTCTSWVRVHLLGTRAPLEYKQTPCRLAESAARASSTDIPRKFIL